MAQVSMTVRMDSQLKQMFDALCAEFGMSANTAMNVFAKAVVQRRSIPFEIRADEKTMADRKAKVAQEGIEKMAPTASHAAGEVAKGITKGIKEGLKDKDEESK